MEDNPPVAVAPGLTLTDPGNDPIDSAKATIGAGFNAAQDSLTVSGALPGGLTSSYNGATGVLTISGSASPADYQQALRQVVFNNNSQNPAPTPRNVTFSIGSQLAFAANGHFYEFIPSSVPNGVSWTSANAAAATKTLYGIQGYLATITSAAENTFIKDKLQGNGWLGASDAAAEGTWKWVAGPENGALLPAGYTAWNAGEPNNAGNEDYAHMIGNPSAGPLGTWNDLANGGGGGAYAVLGYVVEYGGSAGDPALNLSGSVIVNVVPVNDPPTANAGGPYTVDEGSSITLNGSGSDVDSTVLTYAWDLDNNGSFETPGQNVAFNGLDGPASVPVTLRVCDRGTPPPSVCTTDTRSVTVNNVTPSLTVNVNTGNTVYYVDWTAADPGAGTASGVINLPNGDTVNVTFEALNPDNTPSFYYGAQTSGGTNFWNPSAPYISAEVPNAPPASDILQLSGGSNTIYKVTLSEPIVDPIMAIESLGGGPTFTTYEFDSPFTLLSQGTGYHGGDATRLVHLPGNVLQGREGNGTIKFLGSFSTFSWTVPTAEVWHGFTFAIRTTAELGNTDVQEGETATNSGTWSDPGLNGDGVVVSSASVGSVVTNPDGTWNWSFDTNDGPTQSQTVTVTATDKDGAFTSETFELTVNNVAPTILSTSHQVAPIPEGPGPLNPLSGNLVIHASDPAESNDPLTYEFDCDNNGSFETPAIGTSSTANCLFDDNGSYTVPIRVSDDDGGVTLGALTAVVLNVPPTAFLPNAGPVDEGSPATLTFEAEFDPSPTDTTAGFGYSIACDGNPASLATSYATASSSPSQDCTYPDNGSYPVVGRIFDKDGGSNDYSATVQVNNVAPTVTANGDAIDENGTATVSGTITDPGILDTFSVVIDWGEGVPSVFSLPVGSTSYSATHQYLDDNPPGTLSDIYTVNVTVTDKDAATGPASTSVTVNNVAPVLTAGPATATIFSGDTHNISAALTDIGTQDTHGITVNWGDGGLPEFLAVTQGAGTASATGSHQYIVPGTYTITVGTKDDDGGNDSTTLTVEVLPIPVEIDIKPGSDPNSLNLNGNGVVPVGVFGSADIDVTTIDISTLTFGLSGTEATPVHDGHFEDINNDGFMDLVLHFREGELGIPVSTPGETILTLTLNGNFNNGYYFQGQDIVRITPNNIEKSRGKGGKGPK